MCSTGMVRGLGALLALFGIITIIMAVTITTGSSWLADLLPKADGDMQPSEEQTEFAEDVANAGLLFEALIYIFGIYMLVMGALAVQGCGKKCHGKKMCVCLFQIFQLVLFLATIIVALVPTGMYFVTQEDIDWFCNPLEGTLERPAAEMAGLYPETEEEPRSWKAEMFVEGRQFV